MGGLMAKMRDALAEFTGSNPARILMLGLDGAGLFIYFQLHSVQFKYIYSAYVISFPLKKGEFSEYVIVPIEHLD